MVKQILIEVLDLDLSAENIDDRMPLYSPTIGLSSLTLLHLITEFEQAFACEIDDEAVMTADLVNVGSLIELVLGQIAPVGINAETLITGEQEVQ